MPDPRGLAPSHQPPGTAFPGSPLARSSIVKITLTSEDSIRLEGTAGPMTIEAKSADEQYSPFHMLGSSLAFCTFSVLYSWATHAGFSADDLKVDVAWTFTDNPHRVATIQVDLVWPSLPPERYPTAKRAASLCTVHHTLTHPPAITVATRAA